MSNLRWQCDASAGHEGFVLQSPMANLGWKNGGFWGFAMGNVSAQLDKLCIPQKAHDKAELGGVWSDEASAALRGRIDKRIRCFIALNSSARHFQNLPKLKRISGTQDYEKLLDELTDATKKYSAEKLNVANYRVGLSVSSSKRGRPRKPEQQALYFDVGQVLTLALGKHIGIWQGADPQQQSLGLVICRILAASVGMPLPSRTRGIIKKSKNVKRI